MLGHQIFSQVMAQQPDPKTLDRLDWQTPPGSVTMDINPGDAVIFHGNTWLGGWRRETPGTRINLAAYFCRSHIATQELRGDNRYPEVFERFADQPMFAKLMGENQFNGWREEGLNYEYLTAEAGIFFVCGSATDVPMDPEYVKQAHPIAQQTGLKQLALGLLGSNVEVLEGELPPETSFIAIEQFPSMEALKSFYHSEQYQSAIEYRQASVKVNFLAAVDGLSEKELNARDKAVVEMID